MPASQPFIVTEIVAQALGREIAPERRASERRREAEPCAGPAALAEAIMAAGRRHEIAFLARQLSGAEIVRLAAGGTFPIVVPRAVGGAMEALVLLRLEGGRLHGERVDGEGECAPLALGMAELAAQVPGDGQPVPVLVPLLAEPALAASAVELEVRASAHDAIVGAGAHAGSTPLQRLFRLLARERRDVGLIYLYAALAGVFSLTLPLGVQMIVGLVSGGLILQPVVLLIAFVVIGTVLTGALQVMQLTVVEVIQQRVFARLAFEFVFRLPRVHAEQARGNDLPEVMNRFFEIKTIQKSLVKLLTDGVTAMLQVVLGLVLLSFYHPYFTVFGLGLIAIVLVLLRFTGPRGLESALMESKYKYRVLHWLEEVARTVSTFKHATHSNLPVERMDAEVAGYLKYRRKHFGVLLAQSWAAIAVKTIITAGLLVLGTLLVIDRQITLGQFVASEIVIVTVLLGVEKLIYSLADVYDILASVVKAGFVTDLPVDRAGGIAVPDVRERGGIEIVAAGLGYRYGGQSEGALGGVSLVVRPGEKVAITGAEGSGATTLLNVLTGRFEEYTGALSYNGLSSRDADRESLRGLVARAGGEVQLFEGGLEENVAVGRADVTPTDVVRALERVGLGEWMRALPQGLATRIGGAVQLPATISRRIVLARCIAGRPALLAFDEFFDALEPLVKRQVLDVVCSTDAPWGVIAVTHDPAFLAACDRIILLREGRVEREGSYDQLRKDPYFRTVVPPAEALIGL